MALKEKIAETGYYQIYTYDAYTLFETVEGAEASLPPMESLKELANDKEISETKLVYAATSYLPSPEDYVDHLTEEYRKSDSGRELMGYYGRVQEERDSDYLFMRESVANLSGVECFGYREEELKRYQSVLTEGTLDVSPQGVILVNQIKTYSENEKANRVEDMIREYYVEHTDYQVGDTIRLVDVGELHRRLDLPLRELAIENQKLNDELEQDLTYNDTHTIEEHDFPERYHPPTAAEARRLEIYEDSMKRQVEMICSCEKDLMEEGYYHTYTIEGIVSEDVNIGVDMSRHMRIIMPMEQYFELTGTDEEHPTGIMCHTDHWFPNVNRIYSYMSGSDQFFQSYENSGYRNSYEYQELIEDISRRRNLLIAAVVVVVALVSGKTAVVVAAVVSV